MDTMIAGALTAPLPWRHGARRTLAKLLRRASRLLARTAHAIAPPATASSVTAIGTDAARAATTSAAKALSQRELDLRYGVVEFHAEAGALEGALYVNGQLVGTLRGVKRL